MAMIFIEDGKSTRDTRRLRIVQKECKNTNMLKSR